MLLFYYRTVELSKEEFDFCVLRGKETDMTWNIDKKEKQRFSEPESDSEITLFFG